MGLPGSLGDILSLSSSRQSSLITGKEAKLPAKVPHSFFLSDCKFCLKFAQFCGSRLKKSHCMSPNLTEGLLPSVAQIYSRDLAELDLRKRAIRVHQFPALIGHEARIMGLFYSGR